MNLLHPNWMDGVQDWPEEAKQRIHTLEEKNQVLLKENQQLKELLFNFEKRLNALEQENSELKQKITKLENKLRTYENPHISPSQQRFKKRTSKNIMENEVHQKDIVVLPAEHQNQTRSSQLPRTRVPVVDNTLMMQSQWKQ
jgi:UDP-N-acetyl-D-mannosaminuronate dehydrogenase